MALVIVSRQDSAVSASTSAVLIGIISASAGPFLPQWPVALQHDVVQEARQFPGEFAFVVRDIQSGVNYTYNGSTPMYLASGIKIPVLIALYQQVRDKKIRLSQKIYYTAKDVRDGSPLLSYLRPGTPISLRILAEAMIQRSDNAATDLVIKRVGLRNVNAALGREGLGGFGPITTLLEVRRLVYARVNPRSSSLTAANIFTLGMTRNLDARMALFGQYVKRPNAYSRIDYANAFRDYYLQGYNSAPLVAMVDMLERLARGRVVSPAHSAEMVDIMAGTQTGTTRLRAGLPADIRFAHKTGTQFRRTCDFGIVFMPDGRQIVMAFVAKSGRSRAEALMARLARRAYWHLASPIERRRLKKLAELRVKGPFNENRADPEDVQHGALNRNKGKPRLR